MTPRRVAWLGFLRQLVRLGTFLALVGLVADFGLPLEESVQGAIRTSQAALIGLFALESALRLAWAERRLEHARRYWLEITLLVVMLLDVGLALAQERALVLGGAWFYGIQAYLVVRFVLGVARVQSWLSQHAVRPALLLLGSYVLAALLGAGLLLLPLARAPGVEAWSFTDAFFMATSAVCVTGLSIHDVGTELSFRGQALLLLLIQVGGLGLVGVVCSAAILERGRLGVREVQVLGDALGLGSPGRLRRFLVFTLAFTLCVEALGALGLWLAVEGDPRLGHDRAWWSVFHSVSAFCNAGFSLSPTGLMPWADTPRVLFVVCALIVIGGLGFAVHMDLLALRPLSLATLRWWRWRLSESMHWPWRHRVFEGPAPHRLSVSSRIVLRTTWILLLAGTVLFLMAETRGVLAGRPLWQRWTESLFQSVAARTAGFATVDFGAVALPTLLVTILLMGVGASPLSTGGGVKTTTLAVSFLSVRAMTRGRDEVDAFGRSVPRRVVHACIAIAALYALSAVTVTLALLATQTGIRFDEALFESVSALSTVGLSAGVTPRLDTAGRWIVAVAMIAGRIGPLACLWSFVARPGALRYRYPEENVLVS